MSSILNSISAGDLQVPQVPGDTSAKSDPVEILMTNPKTKFENCPINDGGSNISDRSIANYFRFIKLTLMGCPTLTTTTTDTLPIFSLYLKVAGESDTIHLVSKPYTQLYQSFDGTYYVDLKNMCIISKDIFNKSVINT